MNYSALTSLASHRSRPTFFFPSELTKTNSTGNLCSVSNILNQTCSNSDIDETVAGEWNSQMRSSIGLRFVGSPSLTKNVVPEKPLKAEGIHGLKFNADNSRTFLKELTSESVLETKNCLKEDLSMPSFKIQYKGSQCKVAETENSTNKSVPSISCIELVELLADFEALMIIDCRNFMAYNTNHVKGALNINLGNKITRKRFVDGHVSISDLISGPEAKAEYRSKENIAVIVVYDDNARDVTSLPAVHPLKLLTSRLRSSGRDVRFLEGGIQSFQTNFRHFCEHPDVPPTLPLLYSPTSQDVDDAVDTAKASEILPFLYVGNERDASSEQILKELGVTHLLNVTANIPFHFDHSLTCKRLQASDSGCQNLKQYFEEAIEFIENARVSNGRVLVHCQAGVSRSPTIVMAYVMARFDKSLQDAFSIVHNRRSIISPNLNFMGQLLEFGQRKDLASLCPLPLTCKYREMASD